MGSAAATRGVASPAVGDAAAARFDAGDFEGVLALLDRAQVDAADVEVLRGRCLERLSRPGEALAAYAEALSAEPSNLEAQVGLANVLSGLGHAAEARHAWREIVETVALLPEPDAHDLELAGRALYRLDDLVAAEAAFRAACDADPSALSPAFALALVLLHLGETGEANALYRRTASHARVRGAAGAVRAALDDLLEAGLPSKLTAPVADALVLA